MSRKANPTTIGVFVISIVALIVSTLVFFGSGDYLQEKDYYQLFFTDSVKGLRVGSPVLLKGVELGSVKQIHAVNDKEGNFFVKVVIEVISGRVRNEGATLADTQQEVLEFLLNKGLRAQLESQSLLTGQLAVKLDYMPDTEARFVRLDAEYPEMPVVSSPQDRLISQLTETLREVASIPIADVVSELLETMDVIQATMANVHIDDTLAEVRETLGHLRALIMDVQGQVGPTMDRLESSSESVEETIEALKRLVIRLDTILETNDPQLQSTMDDFAAAARSLRSLADYLDRNPEALLKGKKN